MNLKKRGRDKKKTVSISVYLTRLIVILSLILGLGIGLVSMIVTGKVIKNNLEDQSSYFLDNVDSIISEEIRGYQDLLTSLVDTGSYKNLSKSSLVEKFEEQLAVAAGSSESIINIYYTSNEDGAYSAYDSEIPEGWKPTEKDWYTQAVENADEFTIASPYVDVVTGEMVITIYKGIVENSNTYGVFFVDISLTNFSENIINLNSHIDCNFGITDSEGNAVVNTTSENLGQDMSEELQSLNDVKLGEQEKFQQQLDGVNYYEYVRINEDTQWRIYIQYPVSKIYRTLMSDLVILGAFIIGFILFVIFVFRLIGKKIEKGIEKLCDVIKAGANGDFETKININSNIKQVVDVVSDYTLLQNKMSELLHSVDESVKDVEESVLISVARSNEITDSVNGVARTMSDISGGTVESAGNLELVMLSIDQMSEKMNEIERITNGVLKAANQTNTLSENGLDVVSNLKKMSDETRKETEEVTAVVNSVSKSVESIETINSTISSINSQTNLLALNAAIEAARAGEAGKGFAVVAEEIRHLSDETSKSASQITELIYEIKELTNLAVEKAASTSHFVRQQENSVISSEEMFRKILESVSNLSDDVTNIFDSVTNTNAMKNGIVEEVSTLSATMEETSAGSEEVSDAAKAIADTLKESVTMYQELKDSVDELKNQIKSLKY